MNNALLLEWSEGGSGMADKLNMAFAESFRRAFRGEPVIIPAAQAIEDCSLSLEGYYREHGSLRGLLRRGFRVPGLGPRRIAKAEWLLRDGEQAVIEAIQKKHRKARECERRRDDEVAERGVRFMRAPQGPPVPENWDGSVDNTERVQEE